MRVAHAQARITSKTKWKRKPPPGYGVGHCTARLPFPPLFLCCFNQTRMILVRLCCSQKAVNVKRSVFYVHYSHAFDVVSKWFKPRDVTDDCRNGCGHQSVGWRTVNERQRIKRQSRREKLRRYLKRDANRRERTQFFSCLLCAIMKSLLWLTISHLLVKLCVNFKLLMSLYTSSHFTRIHESFFPFLPILHFFTMLFTLYKTRESLKEKFTYEEP